VYLGYMIMPINEKLFETKLVSRADSMSLKPCRFPRCSYNKAREHRQNQLTVGENLKTRE